MKAGATVRALLAALVLAALILPAAAADNRRIVLRIGDKSITATLVDSPTSRDFVSLLPLTIPMRDLFAREKFGDLPRPISEGGERTWTYKVGDVIYWSPVPTLPSTIGRRVKRSPCPGLSSSRASTPVRKS